MANPVLTGAVLVEANGAALNNAGMEAAGARVENVVVVKKIRVGRAEYPYVSGQAWRRWWREVLYADFGWPPSPVTREQKSAYTQGDPIGFAEDDMFGYMAARQRVKAKGAKAAEQTTYRRISPLKNSLLISVLPDVVERDFGHFSRGLKPGEDIIPYESEHYTTYLHAAFTISLQDVGRFEEGEMRDLSPDLVEKYKAKMRRVGEAVWALEGGERVRRVREAVLALGRLRHGANLARRLSDVMPVVVLAGFFDGGNAPLQRLFVADAHGERALLNVDRLRSVLHDYRDRVLRSDEDSGVYFGYRPGVLANEAEVLESLSRLTDESPLRLVRLAGTPGDAIGRAASAVERVMES